MSGPTPLLLSQVRGSALARAAESMLRALGGVEVMLRIPQPAADPRALLGLGTQAVLDYPIAPAIIDGDTADGGPERFEILLAATALDRVASACGAASGVTLLSNAIAIVVGERVLRIESFTEETFGWAPCFFRVLVSA